LEGPDFGWLSRHCWFAYVGLLLIVLVAPRMIVQIAEDLTPDTDAVLAFIIG
jgi:hypothetical protein